MLIFDLMGFVYGYNVLYFRSISKNGEDIKFQILASAEIPILCIPEKIENNGGQMSVISEKLDPGGGVSFQVSAMRDGNSEVTDREEDAAEETDHEDVLNKVLVTNSWSSDSCLNKILSTPR